MAQFLVPAGPTPVTLTPSGHSSEQTDWCCCAGVPYLSDAQERTYREALMSRRLPQPIPFQDFDYHELSAADTVSIELNIQRVMQWHELITDSLKKGEDRSLTLRLQLMPILHRRVLVEVSETLFFKTALARLRWHL